MWGVDLSFIALVYLTPVIKQYKYSVAWRSWGIISFSSYNLFLLCFCAKMCFPGFCQIKLELENGWLDACEVLLHVVWAWVCCTKWTDVVIMKSSVRWRAASCAYTWGFEQLAGYELQIASPKLILQLPNPPITPCLNVTGIHTVSKLALPWQDFVLCSVLQGCHCILLSTSRCTFHPNRQRS